MKVDKWELTYRNLKIDADSCIVADLSESKINANVKSPGYSDFCSQRPLSSFSFVIHEKRHMSDFKLLTCSIRIPRKEKKRKGTQKARKRLIKRLKLGLALNAKDFKRAGFKIEHIEKGKEE